MDEEDLKQYIVIAALGGVVNLNECCDNDKLKVLAHLHSCGYIKLHIRLSYSNHIETHSRFTIFSQSNFTIILDDCPIKLERFNTYLLELTTTH